MAHDVIKVTLDHNLHKSIFHNYIIREQGQDTAIDKYSDNEFKSH